MTSKLTAGVAVTVLVLMLAVTIQAGEFSGSWKGTLTGADSSAADVQIDFSPQGFPLYSYTNNKGVARHAELSHVGQTVEYVPGAAACNGSSSRRLRKERTDFRSALNSPLNARARVTCNRHTKPPCSSMPLSPKG